MKERSHVITNHLFDMTDSICIGSGTVIAGSGTQFWTHSYFITGNKNIRVDSPISIGDSCYIGARCCVLGGVSICDEVIVGAMTCISKSICKKGIYVGYGMRYFEEDENFVEKLGTPTCGDNIYRKN